MKKSIYSSIFIFVGIQFLSADPKNNIKFGVNFKNNSDGAIEFEYLLGSQYLFGVNFEGTKSFCPVCDVSYGFDHLINPSLVMGRRFNLYGIYIEGLAGIGFIKGKEKLKIGPKETSTIKVESINLPIKVSGVYYWQVMGTKFGLGVNSRADLNFDRRYYSVGFPMCIKF